MISAALQGFKLFNSLNIAGKPILNKVLVIAESFNAFRICLRSNLKSYTLLHSFSYYHYL